ncbi:MAG: triose-phosphate isomerase [Bacteroidia bacterium]|nr:triose-phosphate isomerase [Bacteroidia bacterium]NNC85037.1 triose-phosphate isomerase [Bacteroidia bacterium]NNM15119.1 triose-phosphate isomerase [Bacteroidia bacterium]
MSRRKIVAGNWKMNLEAQAAGQLADDIIANAEKEKVSDDVELILIPPFPYLDFVGSKLKGVNIRYGAQDCSAHEEGAFTGEVSATMICSIGAKFILVGHSERRKYFNESAELLIEKMNKVLATIGTPIFCCGESIEDRKSNNHFSVVESQISDVVLELKKSDAEKIIIAYEPVWAIGTGETASPEQAQEMHAFIRDLIEKKFGKVLAKNLPILYGGSVNEKNAADLFKQDDVDGGLVGGASLKAASFIAIAKSF